MDYLSNNIAMNLNRIRKAKNMSFDVVSEQTGVSKSMLAQIERGEANPTIGILGRIASGLRIKFEELIQAPKVENYIMSIKNMVPTKEIPGQYKVYTCFPYEDNRMFEIYRIEIEPSGTYYSGAHGEHTKEYVVVSKGQVDIQIENENFAVTTDDIFKFESDKAHNYSNKGKDQTILYVFFVAL